MGIVLKLIRPRLARFHRFLVDVVTSMQWWHHKAENVRIPLIFDQISNVFIAPSSFCQSYQVHTAKYYKMWVNDPTL